MKLDFATLKSLDQPAQQESQKKQLSDACKEFESIFLHMMWEYADKTNTNGLFNGGQGESIFKSLLYEEFSKDMAQAEQVGIGQIMEKQLARQFNIEEEGKQENNQLETDLLRRKSIQTYQKTKLNSRPQAGKLSRYDSFIHRASAKFNLSEDLISAVIMTESSGNPMALSSKKAMGLMQITPDTAKHLGLERPFNPKDNIDKGAQYLRELLNRYNQDEKLALAAYNAGPGNVDKYNGIPPFKETRNYIDKVLNWKKKFSNEGLKNSKAVDTDTKGAQ